MYDELVRCLRHCVDAPAHRGCAANCKYGKEHPLNYLCISVMMQEAADVIETTPRWVPVTERLPKEGEFVLVYGDLYPNKHDGGVIAVSKRMDWNYWQGFGRERDITHWMPLPTPPQAEEGE